MRKVIVTALAVLATSAAASAAATMTISQHDKKFDQESITVHVGDEIVFKNDDKVAHNVHSSTPDHTFNLGLQKPGETAVLEIESSGTFEIRCAVHPRMKMKVVVE